jgi:probable HAF family extracellular repeat protein
VGHTTLNTAPFPTRAVSWTNGASSQLPVIAGPENSALAVNESNHIVGWSNFAPSTQLDQPRHAALWQNNKVVDLGTLGGARSVARAINSAGVVVGFAQVTGNAVHAFMWRDANGNGNADPGEMVDLNSFISVPGWTLVDAKGINRRGQIVGLGTLNGSPHAFLITPF